MSRALYRKYRPKTLSEVVGQEQVTKTLEQALKQGKVSHAYLFVGPRGTGKTSVARIFAHEINRFPYEIEDDYVDIIEIDGASNRGIDDIRELREKVAIAPSEGKFKVYIIDEVHMLTTPAFNALLKTLEEPPEHVVFLMATTDVQKVPKTILSRAQQFTFRLADLETMKRYLRKVADAEGIKIDDEALAIVAERGGGSYRDSLSLLDQVSALSEEEISRDLVVSAMGLPEKNEIERLLQVYANGNLTEIAGALHEILGAGAKPELLAEGMIRKIIAEPRAEWMGLLARLPDVAAPFPEAKLLVALTAEARSDGEGVGVGNGARAGTETGSRVGETSGAGEAGGTGEAIGASRVGRTARATGSMAETVEADGAATEENETVAEKNETATEAGKTAKANATVEAGGGAFPFDWVAYKKKVSEQNDAIARQLEKVKFELKERTLHLYPLRKIVRNIITKPNNLKILTEAANGLNVKIHEVDEQTGAEAKIDPKMAKLSAIMGGEVVEDGGESPF